MALAFEYLEKNFSILESDYPYTSGWSRRIKACEYDSKPHTDVKVSTYENVPANNPAQLKAAIAKVPVSVAIEADKSVFSNYKEGVLDSLECGTDLDHGVLAVGYGTQDGTEYILVKNSWGPSWGD